jgi:hypothetical protein
LAEVPGKVISVLEEVLNQTAEELEQHGISEEGLKQLAGEEPGALLDFVNAVESLKGHLGKLRTLDERAREKIIGQPFHVAAKLENVQLAADLYAAMLRADKALKLTFKTLKTLLQLFPEATTELERIDPNFPTWLNSA